MILAYFIERSRKARLIFLAKWRYAFVIIPDTISLFFYLPGVKSIVFF